MNLNGIQKSALLLISIGIDEAAKTLEYFSSKEVKQLTQAILSLDIKQKYNIPEIINSFHLFVKENHFLFFDFKKNAFKLIEKGIGEKKSITVIENTLLKKSIQKKIFILEKLDIRDLFSLICKEHDQIITTLLVYFSREVSAQLLCLFSLKKQSNFLISIEHFSFLNTKSLFELNKVLSGVLKNYKDSIKITKNMKCIIGILKAFNVKKREQILYKIKHFNVNFFYYINSILFSWNDLISLSNKDIKFIIKEGDIKILYIALKDKKNSIKNKFFENFSKIESDYFHKKNVENQTFSAIEISSSEKKLLNIIKNFIKMGKIYTDKY